jgi:hypothetical protein
VDFKRFEGYPNTQGCILIVPGRYWANRIGDINEALSRYQWVLLIRTGDEEDLFDVAKIEHPNAKLWVQTPRVGVDYDARLFGVGFPPHFNQLPKDPPEKLLDVFLSCQDTHERRHEAFAALEGIEGRVHRTEGFTQGMDPLEYADCMTIAKIAPCPSGAESPDSFRVFEALEAHAIPIADDVSPVYDSRGYWRTVFPDAPFPILVDYGDLAGWTEDLLEGWPDNANRITAWWMRRKREYAQWLRDDLEALGAL